MDSSRWRVGPHPRLGVRPMPWPILLAASTSSHCFLLHFPMVDSRINSHYPVFDEKKTSFMVNLTVKYPFLSNPTCCSIYFIVFHAGHHAGHPGHTHLDTTAEGQTRAQGELPALENRIGSSALNNDGKTGRNGWHNQQLIRWDSADSQDARQVPRQTNTTSLMEGKWAGRQHENVTK